MNCVCGKPAVFSCGSMPLCQQCAERCGVTPDQVSERLARARETFSRAIKTARSPERIAHLKAGLRLVSPKS
jgi:hypothetical protein